MHFKLLNIYFCFLNACSELRQCSSNENLIDFIANMILCSIITATNIAAAIQLRQRHRVQRECKEMLFKKTGFHVFVLILNFNMNCYVSASVIMTYACFIHIFIAQKRRSNVFYLTIIGMQSISPKDSTFKLHRNRKHKIN